MPRQNRVTPFGDIVAVPARGTLMGNRGCLHDASGRIVRKTAGGDKSTQQANIKAAPNTSRPTKTSRTISMPGSRKQATILKVINALGGEAARRSREVKNPDGSISAEDWFLEPTSKKDWQYSLSSQQEQGFAGRAIPGLGVPHRSRGRRRECHPLRRTGV